MWGGWFTAAAVFLTGALFTGRRIGSAERQQQDQDRRIAHLETELNTAHERIDELYKLRG